MKIDKYRELERSFFYGLEVAIENQKWAKNDEFFKEHDELLIKHYKKSLQGVLKPVKMKINLTVPACKGHRRLHENKSFYWGLDDFLYQDLFLKAQKGLQKPTLKTTVEIKKMMRDTREFQLRDALFLERQPSSFKSLCFTEDQIMKFCQQKNFPKEKHFLFLFKRERLRGREGYRFVSVYKNKNNSYSYDFCLGYTSAHERHSFIPYYLVIPIID